MFSGVSFNSKARTLRDGLPHKGFTKNHPHTMYIEGVVCVCIGSAYLPPFNSKVPYIQFWNLHRGIVGTL